MILKPKANPKNNYGKMMLRPIKAVSGYVIRDQTAEKLKAYGKKLSSSYKGEITLLMDLLENIKALG